MKYFILFFEYYFHFLTVCIEKQLVFLYLKKVKNNVFRRNY